MDREISKEEKRKERNRKLVTSGIFLGVVAAAVFVIGTLIGGGVPESDLTLAKVEEGEIESSVSASGRVVPLFEQTIVSPVGARILEIYHTEGDSVEEGEPLLLLDLKATETETERLADQALMSRNELEQASLNDRTYLTDLEMRIKTKEMSVSHAKAEVANEKRLDSIGTGTGEKIRQAQLAYETGRLELEQLKMQLENERKSHAAALRSRKLESDISHRNLESMRRTLEDARIKAPIRGTVTWVNKSVGSMTGAGEKLAVISDLTHMKINASIAESNSGNLSLGAPVYIRVNRKGIPGHVSNISPQSNNGSVEFTVSADEDHHPLLRSGLRVDLNVVFDVKEAVKRIPNGQYFQGAGTYRMFVRKGNKLERRDVSLGDSNFDWVEVLSGLNEGEDVVVNDMAPYQNKSTLKIKKQ